MQGRREVSFVFTRLQLIVRLIEMISTLFQPFFQPFSNLFPTLFNLFQPVATSKGATFARCRCPGVGVKARLASVGRGEFYSVLKYFILCALETREYYPSPATSKLGPHHDVTLVPHVH